MINAKYIASQTIKFNLVNIFSFVIQIPVQFVIGLYIPPKDYGIMGLMSLWLLYSSLINPGMLSTAQREIPYYLGNNEIDKSIIIQNVAISSDLIYSFFTFLVIIFSSIYYDNKIIKIALLITSVNYLTNRFVVYWSSINITKQKFTLVAIGKFIGSFIPQLFILSSIFWIKIYSLLIAPIFGSIIALLYFLKKAPINFKFIVNKKEIYRQIKVGIIFSLIGIVYYGHRMADSTMIATYFSLEDLGIFAYAMGFVTFGINFLADIGRVLQPMIWEYSGKIKEKEKSFEIIKIIAIYLSLIVSFFIPFIQIIYWIIIKIFVNNYVNSIGLFFILSNLLFLTLMQIFPCIILESFIVNKQNTVTYVYSAGLIVSILLNGLIIVLGFGIIYITFVTILSHLMVMIILYRKTKMYITNDINDFKMFMIKINIPFIISLIFTFGNLFLLNSDIFYLKSIVISCLLQIIIWLLLAISVYKEYFVKDEIIIFMKKLINDMK